MRRRNSPFASALATRISEPPSWERGRPARPSSAVKRAGRPRSQGTSMPDSVLILIPARMASTRLPGKPLADIAGRPMIVHVLDRARETSLGPVYVATDSQEIATAAAKAGGQAVMTRADHASGPDPIFRAATPA